MQDAQDSVDSSVRAAIYQHFARNGHAPTVEDLARETGHGAGGVIAAYERLSAKRMLVLLPDRRTIRMAPPFSGVETQHQVFAQGKAYFANCAWDAFGIVAALRSEGHVSSRCEETLEPLNMHLSGEAPGPSSWLFHAAVPAAHWWRDIVYT